MTTLIFLVVLLVVIHRATPPETRVRVLQAVVAEGHRLKEYGREELNEFRLALRARTSRVVATPLLIAVNAIVFVWMHAGTGDLLSWGASVGPRTTNGEWWRIVTAMFVHLGLLSLIVNMIALRQVGVILERLVGPIAFASTYVAAGMLAGVANISAAPLAVSAGASGAVFGLYGVLLASLAWTWLKRSTLTVPSVAVKRLVPVTLMFGLYNLFDPSIARGAEFVALLVGLAFGAFVCREVSERTPEWRPVAAAAGAGLAIAAVWAFPLRGIADVRPELQRLADVEQRTAHAYGTATNQFARGRMTIDDLTQLIDGTILPELRSAEARFESLRHVAKDDEQRVADARLYLQLRSSSWRLRADSLRTANTPIPPTRARAEARHRSMNMLRGRAEAAERSALEALNRTTP